MDKIILNSNGYDVAVQSAESNNVFATVYSNSLGFTLVENSTVDISATYTASSRRLQIDVTEPHGFTLKNRSLVTLYLPESCAPVIEFVNNSANTTINASNLTLSGLSYKTTKGNLNLANGTFNGSLKIDIGNATCTINESAVTATNDVNLQIGEGKFDAPSKDFNNFTIASNVRGVIIMKSCQLLTQTESENAGGRLNIETLNNSNYVSGDTNVSITNMLKGNINLTKSGSINIENCTGSASYLTTLTGSISVNNAEANIQANSSYGNITINNANNFISTKTNGKATINFKDNATGARHLDARTTNGSINVTGVNLLEATATGVGSVKAMMHDVASGCNVKVSQGNANIIFADGDKFTLYVTQADGGSFYFEDLATPNPITSIPTDGKIIVNGDTENISFNIESSQGGSIRIVDKSMSNY
ncbi:MAG: hypothetical protein MJ149_02965 [Clostridia bacterium]|nr:hypothetical protein [Clostridia bacterium]